MSNEQYPERPAPAYSIPELSPTIQAAPVPASPPTPRRRWVSYGSDILLGLGLLLAGMPLAWLLGIGMARVISLPRDRMPLQEVVLRRTNRVITEIQRLPSRWQPAPPPETRIEPIPIPTQPVVPLTQPPAALNARERQIAEEELAALQQEFETIRKRLFDLESKLGQAQSTEDVESRLVRLENRLAPSQPLPSATLPAAPSESPSVTSDAQNDLSFQHPLLETTELKITLPSDALFAPGEARLLSTAPGLLNTIFEDLDQYSKATILIGSHTDDQIEPSQSQALAFQQATALRAYLAGNLPNHRWVTIGYGQSQPITDNSTPALRQRNRRIEIAIDRR
ncbi:OmpA family protein [Leptothoe spongobia]|uniref:OmpA family protein n=1 Tax=Leptothoe spongobia TAU-MAC 1115 TaxID=1967444 RepID=A0A947DGE9_9CYAN|nr:OmpA family protein [Leptothoe spongobia]MBT9316098.1 OmpA family protein [Leptothoe spongobia TAU-MAC 1115]